MVTLDPAKKYNYVHGDAFNDFSVPYHLTTREFNELVKRHLTPDGIYLTNIIDGRDLPFARALMRTMQATFAHVYFVPTNKAYRDIRANTMLVLATDRPLDTQALAALNGHDERSQFGAPASLRHSRPRRAWRGPTRPYSTRNNSRPAKV